MSLKHSSTVIHAGVDWFCVNQSGLTLRQVKRLGSMSESLARGVRLVQLREPQLPTDIQISFYREALSLCHDAGARALIHDDADLAMHLGADGVHLSAR